MTRSLPVGFVGACLLALACPSGQLDPDACERACDLAAGCGILPSILGNSQDDDPGALHEACVDRCTATDEDAPQSPALLACLTAAASPGVCDVDICTDAILCLRGVVPTGAVGEPEVTFKLIDGEVWTALFQPRLCADLPPDATSLPDDEQRSLCAGDEDPCPPGDAPAPVVRPPLCVADACAPGDAPPSCDPRLCGPDRSPDHDCELFGIAGVQFGYLDHREELHLDPKIHSCSDAGRGVILAGVDSPVIYPVARFTGALGPPALDLLNAPAGAAGRPFCWLARVGDDAAVGWLLRAGANMIPVPSPGAARLAALVAGDPSGFPRGCGCLDDGFGCEDDPAGERCSNGVDDDLDGLVDAEDPGCAP